jgi:hypothetical protein
MNALGGQNIELTRFYRDRNPTKEKSAAVVVQEVDKQKQRENYISELEAGLSYAQFRLRRIQRPPKSIFKPDTPEPPGNPKLRKNNEVKLQQFIARIQRILVSLRRNPDQQVSNKAIMRQRDILRELDPFSGARETDTVLRA